MAGSIEEQIEDWCKKQLNKYFTKNESINSDIDEALRKAPSKSGGDGANYPDIKCLIHDKINNKYLPVMIEVKGSKGDFDKKDKNGNISNLDKDGEIDYKTISRYAVNGAVHYAKAILDYSDSYTDCIAVGVNGFEEGGKIKYQVGAYYLSKDNLFLPKKIANYSDLTFLEDANLSELFDKIKDLELTEEEREFQKQKLEDEIEKRLKNINQIMHDFLNIVVDDRVKLITGLIIAGLGVENKVSRLRVDELKGEMGRTNNDGCVIINKINDFMDEKNLPREKVEMIMAVLKKVFVYSNLYQPINGESVLKKVYSYVDRDIMPFLSSNLHNIDFTGRLFNVLNDWVSVPDGAQNDVVLTPRQTTQLMARLAKVNRNSYVWDFATGSAGFLISAMHIMIEDARANIINPTDRDQKIRDIKEKQLLGIEKLPDIYLLAVLNMILMRDGSSNIIHKDSLTYSGEYEQGEMKGKKFPADVFLLNPPYSAEGKGLIFVQQALSKMDRGYGVVLIQENCGDTQGGGYAKKILERNTLLASIHMPKDLFIGKSNVQTAIYVFKVNEPHDKEQIVKFIDFSNDGYSRQNRRRSSQKVNLKNVDHANERYDEIVNLVLYGPGLNNKNLNYYKDNYIEDYITLEGNDWTYQKHQVINTIPTEDDFKKVIKDYLSWRITDVINNGDDLGK